MSAEQFDRHMSDADALLWNIEADPILRSTIVTVMLLDQAPDWERLVDKIDRGTRLIPRLRQRVVDAPFKVGPPHWSADPHFELDYHLRRVRSPEPGDRATLFELVRPIAMAGFDRSRPLWEFTLIEGLEGGGAAMAVKVHHSITDGVGGIRLAMMLFDLERTPQSVEPMPPVPTAEDENLVDRFWDWVAINNHRLFGLTGEAMAATTSGFRRAVSDPVGAATQAVNTLGSYVRMMKPATTPMSPIMKERSLGRHLHAFEFPLDDFKRAAKDVGGTLNDAFVAGVGLGLERYHRDHGVDVEDLRLLLPINLRDDDSAGGNHFTPARFPIPVGMRNRDRLIVRIGELVDQWRNEPAVAASERMAAVLNRLPAAATTVLFGSMLKGSDFVASNVPGVTFDVYLAGARLERNFAFAPLSGTGAAITLMSHRDVCCIGIATDDASVPDPAHFAECVRSGLAEVLEPTAATGSAAANPGN